MPQAEAHLIPVGLNVGDCPIVVAHRGDNGSGSGGRARVRVAAAVVVLGSPQLRGRWRGSYCSSAVLHVANSHTPVVGIQTQW